MDVEKENLKDTVLVNLRSVTQSAKGGVPINRLQEDYKQWIGKPIPFQDLGYKTLEQFLINIPRVVQLIRKGADNQLYVEAVTDSSTAHLANLISKQKGATVKSSKASKKYGFRSFAVNKKPANSSRNLEEKDKIIADLRCSLELERNVNKDISSQLIRLNCLIKTGQDSLELEQQKVKKLEDQLQAFKENVEMINKPKEDTEVYIKTINSLKSKELETERLNKILLSRVNQFFDINQSRIKDEKELLLQINNQIDYLRAKNYSDFQVTNTLSSINSTIMKRILSLKTLKVSLEAESEQNVNSTSTSTIDGNNNTYSNILNLYAEQCEKIQDLENQLKQQNSAVKKVETKFEKQFQKLYSKVNIQSQESAGMKYTIAQLTGLLESQILNKKETIPPDSQCQRSETEKGENKMKEDSEISSVVGENITPTKRKKKRKKTKDVTENSSVYVPPHRRTDMNIDGLS